MCDVVSVDTNFKAVIIICAIGSCRMDPIHFLSGWHKMHLDQTSLDFVLFPCLNNF